MDEWHFIDIHKFIVFTLTWGGVCIQGNIYCSQSSQNNGYDSIALTVEEDEILMSFQWNKANDMFVLYFQGTNTLLEQEWDVCTIVCRWEMMNSGTSARLWEMREDGDLFHLFELITRLWEKGLVSFKPPTEAFCEHFREISKKYGGEWK